MQVILSITMIEATLKIKKWGNSLGVILPTDIVKKKKLKEGSTIDILVTEGKNINLEEVFGTFKFKKSAQQIKDEIRKGW